MVLLLWHFRHLNPILCGILLKAWCPQGNLFSRLLLKGLLYTLVEFFFYNVEAHECSFDRAQIRIVNDYISVRFASRFLRCAEGFLYFCLCWSFFLLLSLIHHSTLLFFRQHYKQVKWHFSPLLVVYTRDLCGLLLLHFHCQWFYPSFHWWDIVLV